MANCDPSIIDEDLAHKYMKDTMIFYKSFGDIIKDYYGVTLHTNIVVLGVTIHEEIMFEVKDYVKKLQDDFIGTKICNIK
jgi:hypothetical protein